MLFKSPEIGLQWIRCHPRTRAAVTSVDAQIQLWRLPEITITDLERPYSRNVDIYTKLYLDEGHEPGEALARAEAKLSYHFPGVESAADFRSSGEHYSPADNDRIHGWMLDQFPLSQFEVLVHDLGLGLHHHIAFKAKDRLDAWVAAHRAGKGLA